jgi:transcriptional regulator with AAA-type ATPase domain
MTTGPSPRGLFSDTALALLDPVSRLPFTNPFEPAWEALHEAALAHRHVRSERGDATTLRAQVEEALVWAQGRLAAGAEPTPRERAVCQGVALFLLWDGFAAPLGALVDRGDVEVPFWEAFALRHEKLRCFPGVALPEPAHLLALLYQARRAHGFIARKIGGRSPSAAAARAALWRAILGGDPCAYAGGLYRRMTEIPVLITGETGTGKELAAQCVGLSGYIPFDPALRRFVARFEAEYHARNLGEVPRDLVESALFGHRKGAFSGALADAQGYFALPGEHGALFLDEIGELPEHVQAKLLRPLQSREFVPLGDPRPRPCLGRHLFATHRDLAALCRAGTFRADLHERLDGARIHMPPLRLMLAEAPDDLRAYVHTFVADKLDDPAQVEAWTERVVAAVRAGSAGHPWPRNLRELRNATNRALLGDGRPSVPDAPASVPPRAPAPAGEPPSVALPSSGILGPVAKAGRIQVEELTRDYVTRVHVLTGQNTAETARRTGLDRRTVTRWLDQARLRRWLAPGKK